MTFRSASLRLSLSLSVSFFAIIALCSSPAQGVQSARDPSTSLSPSAVVSAAALATLTHNKEQMPSDDDLELLGRLQEYNNNNVGKRAYTYVSEFKRLPVYNFGLGKRSQPQLYGFGLGKRSTGGRTYSFGLGKRSEEYNDEFNQDGSEDSEEGSDGGIIPDEEDMMEKRNRLYSFGLGKRVNPYSFGLGKRSPGENGRQYSFGLGKRGRPSMYDFGLGKRSASGRQYSFGLGKRPSGMEQKSRFNFGLGKRSYDDTAEDVDDFITDDILEEAKRSLADHRFSFGLGKREVSPGELKEVDEEAKRKQAMTRDHVMTKRSLQYGFGLGKRSRLAAENGASVSFADEGDMSRFARRPYSFGLGKRVPMYDFGIGKKSER